MEKMRKADAILVGEPEKKNPLSRTAERLTL
jgi:hypothetical protein